MHTPEFIHGFDAHGDHASDKTMNDLKISESNEPAAVVVGKS